MTALDEIDRTILTELRNDARCSYAHLARVVNLSPPSVQDRVRRLERRGIVSGYRAMLSPESVGITVTALVGVYQTDTGSRTVIAEGLALIAEIEDCWVVAGDEAFVVKVRTTDMASLERILDEIDMVSGVAHTRTTVVLSTRWEHRPVPIPELP